MVVTIIDFLSVCTFPSEPESKRGTERMVVTNGEVRTAQTQPFKEVASPGVFGSHGDRAASGLLLGKYPL